MKKLKLQAQMTVDGFIVEKHGEMDWISINWTDDIKNYVNSLVQSIDTILLGRNLAAGFIPYWPAVAKDKKRPEKEEGIKYSETHKIVFSKTLTQSKWENTEIENGDFIEKNMALKQQPGKDMIVYGGEKFVSSLIREKLVDELPLFINPVILGKGIPANMEHQI